MAIGDQVGIEAVKAAAADMNALLDRVKGELLPDADDRLAARIEQIRAVLNTEVAAIIAAVGVIDATVEKAVTVVDRFEALLARMDGASVSVKLGA